MFKRQKYLCRKTIHRPIAINARLMSRTIGMISYADNVVREGHQIYRCVVLSVSAWEGCPLLAGPCGIHAQRSKGPPDTNHADNDIGEEHQTCRHFVLTVVDRSVWKSCSKIKRAAGPTTEIKRHRRTDNRWPYCHQRTAGNITQR